MQHPASASLHSNQEKAFNSVNMSMILVACLLVTDQLLNSNDAGIWGSC